MQACALLGAWTLAAVSRHIDTQFCSDQACAEATLITRAMIETRQDFHIGVPPCGWLVSLARADSTVRVVYRNYSARWRWKTYANSMITASTARLSPALA